MAYLMIGLDRGSCEVKAVVLEKSFRGYEVKGTRKVRVPQDGSAPPTREAVQSAVAAIVEAFDPGQVGYVTDFPGSRASTWFVQLPFTDQRRIDMTLPYELENYVPFDLEEMVLDYRTVRSEDGQARVLAALAPAEEVGAALQSLKKLKVDPRAIILDGDALTHVPPGKNNVDKTLAIVDIGHTQTLITVRRGNQPDFIRAIPLGGLQVTQAIMRTFGVNYRTAEEMKVRLGPVEPIPDDTMGESASEGAQSQEQPSSPEAPSSAEAMEAEQGPPAESLEVSEPEPDPDIASLDSSTEMHVFETLKALEDEPTETDGVPTVRVVPDEEAERDASDATGDTPGGGGEAHGEAEPTTQPTEAGIRSVIEEAMQPLLREIRSALIAYEGSERHEVDAMLLVGGGSLFPGLPEAFQEALAIPVGRPVRIGPDQTALDDETTLCRYAKAFALAYVGATDTRQGVIDFRKGEFSYQKNYLALRRYLFAALALAFLGAVAATVVFITQVQKLRQESRELDAQITEAIKAGFPDLNVDVSRGIEMAIAQMREQYEATKTRGKLLGLGDSRRTSIDLLKEISSVVPSSEEAKIDVDDFSFEGNQVKLRGTADKFESIDKVEKAIQSSELVLETKSEGGSKGDKRNFKLVITLREPDETAVN